MSKAATAQKEQLKAAPLDPSVRALGVVSLLNDFSSEVAVRTLPLFLANVLGVRIGIIGLIEGIAESTATLLKLVSGYLSDRFQRKKALALWGYGFSNLTKPLLYFATFVGPGACGAVPGPSRQRCPFGAARRFDRRSHAAGAARPRLRLQQSDGQDRRVSRPGCGRRRAVLDANKTRSP